MRERDLSIGDRLGIGFGVVLFLLLAQTLVTAAFVRYVSSLQREKERVYAPRRDAAEALRVAYLTQAISLRSYALTQDAEEREAYEDAASAGSRCFAELVRLQGAATSGNRLSEIGILSSRYADEADRFLELAGTRPSIAAWRGAETRLATARAALLGRVNRLAGDQWRAYQSAEETIVRARRTMLWSVIALALLLAAATLWTALVTTRAVRAPALRLLKSARAMAAGDLAAALAIAGEPGPRAPDNTGRPRDELGELTGVFAGMARALRDREMRLGADARVARALSSSIQVERIAADALREVAGHARCDVGALYLLDAEADVLRCAAGYAFEADPAPVPAGDGILGQALRDKQSVVVRGIPVETPFRVRLGVDEAPPRSVAAVPVLFGANVIGVMVLASLRDLGDEDVGFAEHCAAQLGVSLHNALTHEEVIRLAEALQEKSEALDAQNEELQAQNEEIQAQNEELQVQSEEIRTQNEELGDLSRRVQEQILDLRQAWADVEGRNRALAEADRQKDEFLAMLAHELRNPLAAITNASHLLERATADESTAVAPRAIITRQTAHLVRLVDDLLDVSRITRGTIELRRERLDLRDVVGRSVEATSATVSGRRHRLSVQTPGSPLLVLGDPARLEQVLTNLITNAAKYTPPGGCVSVSLAPEGGSAVLRVRDTGRGIAPEELPHIFDLFVQGERTLDRTEGGLGIGLTLVRRLVELHGGQVTAESQGPEKGSTFTVRLPLAADEDAHATGPEYAERAPATGTGSREPLSVLVVDDNRDAADTLADLLSAWGCDTAVAYDGPAAIETTRERRPDVVLLDLGLPGMDGCEVAEHIREDCQLPGILLAAVTGYSGDDVRQRCEQVGFDHHLTKPVDLEELRSLLESHARA